MTESLIQAAVIGKVPWHPEFLRASQLSPELCAFDEWLFRNAQLPVTDANVGPYGFLLHVGPDEARLSGIAGVISPSHDVAGRHYPLAIAGRVVLAGDVAAHPEVLPILLEAYWQTAVDILNEVRVGPPHAHDWRLERLSQIQMDSCDTAFDLYANWAERVSGSQLCSLLGRPAGWLASAVATIAVSVALEGHGGPRAVRVPLGQAAGPALCFWLDVVRRAAAWHARVPSFFWSYGAQEGDALVFVGAPGDMALTALWGGPAWNNDVCDVAAQNDALGDGSAASSIVSGSEGIGDGGLWPVLNSVATLAKVQSR